MPHSSAQKTLNISPFTSTLTIMTLGMGLFYNASATGYRFMKILLSILENSLNKTIQTREHLSQK